MSGKRSKAASEFAEQPGTPEPMITRALKVAAIRREIAFREKAWPKWIEQGRMSQQDADTQMSHMRAVLKDYEREPWPQLTRFVTEWFQGALKLTFLGAPVRELTRDELLALVAYLRDALEDGGTKS